MLPSNRENPEFFFQIKHNLMNIRKLIFYVFLLDINYCPVFNISRAVTPKLIPRLMIVAVLTNDAPVFGSLSRRVTTATTNKFITCNDI